VKFAMELQSWIGHDGISGRTFACWFGRRLLPPGTVVIEAGRIGTGADGTRS